MIKRPLSWRLFHRTSCWILGGCVLFLLCQWRSGFAINGDNIKDANERDRILKGPLKISAGETLSKNKGKVIEATGKVLVNYDLENGDTIESVSHFARYDEKTLTGELTGNPKAVWRRKDPTFPQTTLIADKIILKVKEEELYASGNVHVLQTSSTLKAEEVLYSNREKKMAAMGGRPEFDVQGEAHHTKIQAEKIDALTERKQINFNGNVKGVVWLRKGSSAEVFPVSGKK